MRLRRVVALNLAACFAVGLGANNISSRGSNPQTTLIDTVVVTLYTEGPSVQSLVSATPAPPIPAREPESTTITRPQVTQTAAPSSESRPVTLETKRNPSISQSLTASSGLDQKSSEKQSSIPRTKTVEAVTVRTESRGTPTSYSRSISISSGTSTASTSSNPSTSASTPERVPTRSRDNASSVPGTQTPSVTGGPPIPTAAATKPQGSKLHISKKTLMAIVISGSGGLIVLSIAVFLAWWHTRRSRRQAQNYCDESYRSNELKRLQQSPVVQYTGKDVIESGNWPYADESWAFRSAPAKGANAVRGFGKAVTTPSRAELPA
ncbi:hypothetical protein K469DRAFT_719515 [Zopfia rhizophila CBS 207.26]|uniref:Mid2 domain-containing protein n=1 Tax=Zopfia rhizophila CBS 207.26 TaxID=1314779 RepID=A0A6A6DH91_9PEZI|nr:hypothetical protein K469DRAFT_719515 [Zopfia rhizophila CBS 207.26]